ncbi:MAG: ATP-binding protein [Syntrophales bacterium]|nr:ATP-binding protein [Syntrophales bacterium]
MVEGAYEATDYYEDLGGQKRYLYFLAAPIYDESGRIIAAIETLQDVTREREMERGLKEYAETLKDELYANITLRNEIEELYTFLQSVIESSPDRIFVLNTDGVVTYASRESAPEGESGRGIRGAADVKGKYFWELVDPENRGLVEKKWAEVKSGVFRPFEIDSIDAAGTGKNMLISVTPIRGTDRYISVQRDIAEFKSLEKRFYETEKLAAVGQLSAGIAHEVRNPLSSIKMSLQILEKRLNPSGNDLKRFKIAEKEVEHLEKLVNDILLFARPADPVIEPGDINESVKNSLNMAEKEISDKKIEIRLDFAAGLPQPGFDQAMLKQALLNIYLNAIDAMDAGGKLTIVTRTADGERPAVEIEIRDTGTGIDEEALPHIFNPFFTTKNYGTGLGLAHVKKIIDLHNGSIEVFSKKGQGVRVILRLPA